MDNVDENTLCALQEEEYIESHTEDFIKWLNKIMVLERPFEGFFMDRVYRIYQKGQDLFAQLLFPEWARKNCD